MFRGGIVSLIYSQTLTLIEGSVDDSAAVSLMSNDVDQIAYGLEELNEIWSRFLELAIGVPLLALQLGWASMMPLIVVARECISLCSGLILTYAQSRLVEHR